MKKNRTIIVDSFYPGSIGYLSLTLLKDTEIGPEDRLFMITNGYYWYKTGLGTLNEFSFPVHEGDVACALRLK